MATVLEHPSSTEAAQDQLPALRRFTVEEYYKLAEAGILRPDERVELIEGRIVTMSPKGTRHAAATDRAARCFAKHLGDRVLIRNQNPVHLTDDTEPEPDVVLAVPQEKEYANHHPTPAEVLLVLEVSESSLSFDRRDKGFIYAKAGIIQYAVLNTRARELEDYRGPSLEGYRSKQTYRADQSFSLVAFPEVVIGVGELLPPE